MQCCPDLVGGIFGWDEWTGISTQNTPVLALFSSYGREYALGRSLQSTSYFANSPHALTPSLRRENLHLDAEFSFELLPYFFIYGCGGDVERVF